ncbi:Hypothetical protein MADA3029_1140107 [Vibrio nigripulchritudo MADA3029]|uniref:hypothetical protein n=1 Tax=Vibrio nigripulchritudo TaxID=28173 RepID=UPI0003B21ABA|nr:hypothetical protein [Vibrio nigripulchritudo]CCN45165.1 Hypothetical protein VIBNIMADA3020_10108 [Vibrio nigripulchritudo MADA3020]CCN54503.1 Hypothetical protein VIBNIMADA3021_550107 [Vibrio nigripulchritudo MADA3021]CCN57553.1 Hypothetical protein MADA3029_1140107 [Vibrio nigripulchritudo MADA3029]
MKAGKVLFSLMLLVPTYAYSYQCAIEIPPISCDGRSGIFMKNPGSTLVKWDEKSPYTVKGGEQLSVAVCNYKNSKVTNQVISDYSLIPTIIGSVGKNASLRIDITNSANIEVSHKLVMGEELPEGLPNNTPPSVPPVPEPDIATPALISDIIHGDVKEGAQIQVNVESSANVRLTGANSELHIGKASLFEEVINKPRDGQHSHIHFGCLQLDLEDTANVYGTKTSHVYIRDGQLEDENIDYTLGISSILIEKENVANVRAKELHIFDGELSDESVDTQNFSSSNINLIFDNVGNARVDSLRIVDGELVDEVLDTSDVRHSLVSISLDDVANATGAKLHIHEGELLDEVMDAQNIAHSNIAISLEETGNSATVNNVYILEGELIDEVMDIGKLDHSLVSIDIEESANSSGFNTTIHHGELLDETLDAIEMNHSGVSIELEETGNVFGGGKTYIEWGELVDEVLDVESSFKFSRANIEVSDSANSNAKDVEIIRGELLDETFDVQDVTNANIAIDVRHTGNVRAVNQLKITHGELVDEVFDHRSIIGSTVNVDLNSVAIAGSSKNKAQNVTLKHAELLDEVVDTELTMTSTSGTVKVKKSANAFSNTLNLEMGSLADRFVDVPVEAPISLQKVNSGEWKK